MSAPSRADLQTRRSAAVSGGPEASQTSAHRSAGRSFPAGRSKAGSGAGACSGMVTGCGLTREGLKALDADRGRKKDSSLDALLKMRTKDRRRKIRAVEDGASFQLPKNRRWNGHAQAYRGTTKGLGLPGLRAVVCMDYIEEDCHVAIQCREGRRSVVVPPEALHPSLEHWSSCWESGSGLLSAPDSRRFRAEVLALEEEAGRTRAAVDALF